MKKFLLFILPVMIYADTTMCFKSNWSDPSTVENEKFDGGECLGKYSIKEMKKNGWNIDDIKISTKNDSMNFIYILKKDQNKKKITNITNNEIGAIPIKNESDIDYDKLANKLEEKKEKKKEISDIEEGKEYYKKICQKCHGKMGEISVYGRSRPLNSLTIEEIKTEIRAYTEREKTSRTAIVMKPYADLVNEVRLENIKAYLDSINK